MKNWLKLLLALFSRESTIADITKPITSIVTKLEKHEARHNAKAEVAQAAADKAAAEKEAADKEAAAAAAEAKKFASVFAS